MPSPFLLLLFFLPLSWAASPESAYNSFLRCLSNHSTQSPHRISSVLYSSGNSSFSTILQSRIRNRRFNRSTTPKPLIILTPLRKNHVQAAVLCTKSIGTQLRIRSGGHDYDGISYVSDTPFLILDLFKLRNITVDLRSQTAWVQAGATVGELYNKIASASDVHGFPAGICPTMGVGGHFSGGGYGNMLRKYGLSVDNIVDAEIVDVNGRILDRKAMGEDLFWAIRGGGGASFGVVLSYKIKLVPVPQIVTVFRVEKSLEENATDIVYRWQHVADKIDNNLFIRLVLQPVKRNGDKTVKASFMALFLGDAKRLMEVMKKGFPELGLVEDDCEEMSWIESVLYWAGFGRGTSADVLLDRSPESVEFLKRKSDYIQSPIPRNGFESIWKKMMELGETGLVFNPYGGKMSEIPANQTPFPHRAGNIFKIQYSVSWEEEGIDAERKHLDQIRSLYYFMAPFVSKSPRGAFFNYRDVDIGITHNGKNSYREGQVYGVKYFKGNFERLVKVKSEVDPGNFFRNEQSIPVSHQKGGTEEARDAVRLICHCFSLLVIALFC
ncbi:berberine bridge enzyme-like 21 [Diospyros lotus]|uniref:berberine bridge enzyme-like 21 n=1 Tax=Diospyros lotus TaxID=55363 RepID=UPI00224E8363|nr:berberine bridge enzyme-like 21 [Diospyros lotus]